MWYAAARLPPASVEAAAARCSLLLHRFSLLLLSLHRLLQLLLPLVAVPLLLLLLVVVALLTMQEAYVCHDGLEQAGLQHHLQAAWQGAAGWVGVPGRSR